MDATTQAQSSTPPASTEPPETPRRRPRFLPLWFAMTPLPWFRLLARHGFRVSPRYLPRVILTTLLSPFNLLLASWISLLHGWRLRRVKIEAPLFVIGHWRSGTTLLHELLALDPRHAWPDGFACFIPAHSFRTRKLLRPFMRWLIPAKRPMDSMDLNLALPQEDEFALLLLGAPSPYERLAFPGRGLSSMERLDPAQLTPREQGRFDRTMRRFFASVMLGKQGRRLVLKSPPHMGRLETLARLYPDLKVLHIVRDPRAALPSMARMLAVLQPMMQLKTHPGRDLLSDSAAGHAALFKRFEASRQVLPAGALLEVRYEDLVTDPVATLRRVYEQLRLGDFAGIEPALAAQVAKGRFHAPRMPPLSAAEAATIDAHAGLMMQRYGYR